MLEITHLFLDDQYIYWHFILANKFLIWTNSGIRGPVRQAPVTLRNLGSTQTGVIFFCISKNFEISDRDSVRGSLGN